jgi:hypothetical protein
MCSQFRGSRHEHLDALGVLDLDRGLRRHRLQLGVQGDKTHEDGLAGLVDRLVGLQEQERALLDLHLGAVREAGAVDDDLVVAACVLRHLELDGALPLDVG